MIVLKYVALKAAGYGQGVQLGAHIDLVTRAAE